MCQLIAWAQITISWNLSRTVSSEAPEISEDHRPPQCLNANILMSERRGNRLKTNRGVRGEEGRDYQDIIAVRWLRRV